MFDMEIIERFSSKKIKFFNGNVNFFNIQIEEYTNDNIIQMKNLEILNIDNSLLPVHYKMQLKKENYFKKIILFVKPKKIDISKNFLISIINEHIKLFENISVSKNKNPKIDILLTDKKIFLFPKYKSKTVNSNNIYISPKKYKILEDISLNSKSAIELTLFIKKDNDDKIIGAYYSLEKIYKKEF
jgi:hypothetical protein